MRIFRAFGLGILILLLQFLVPNIFVGFEDTTVLLFETLQAGLEVTKEGLDNAPTL